jgi:hypothetical protein
MTTPQLGLFDRINGDVDQAALESMRAASLAPRHAGPAESKRLSSQCQRILALLCEQGMATNSELAAISLKYTSRISDLRQAGYPVVCRENNKTTGRSVYVLEVAR